MTLRRVLLLLKARYHHRSHCGVCAGRMRLSSRRRGCCRHHAIHIIPGPFPRSHCRCCNVESSWVFHRCSMFVRALRVSIAHTLPPIYRSHSPQLYSQTTGTAALISPESASTSTPSSSSSIFRKSRFLPLKPLHVLQNRRSQA